MIGKRSYIFFFKQRKSLVCIVCAPHPFSDMMFDSPFVSAILTLEFSIKCFLSNAPGLPY